MRHIFLMGILFLISGCSAGLSKKDEDLNRSINSVKNYLKSNGLDDASYLAVDCNATKEDNRYYVLCVFDSKKNEWGNHSMYVLSEYFELLEIIPGR